MKTGQWEEMKRQRASFTINLLEEAVLEGAAEARRDAVENVRNSNTFQFKSSFTGFSH